MQTYPCFPLSSLLSLASPLYIHSVFMPVDNKEHGSIHAGGGVTGNSWQLFKYLLSVSRSLFSLSLSLLFASRLWSPVEEAEGGEGRGWGGSGGVTRAGTSISNSLSSPHASRGSDLMLRRKIKAPPSQCFTTRKREWLT